MTHFTSRNFKETMNGIREGDTVTVTFKEGRGAAKTMTVKIRENGDGILTGRNGRVFICDTVARKAKRSFVESDVIEIEIVA